MSGVKYSKVQIEAERKAKKEAFKQNLINIIYIIAGSLCI